MPSKKTKSKPEAIRRSSAPACSVPRRFVDDVDSLLTCLLYRHRKAVDATGEYAEIAKLAREARELTEAPNPTSHDRTIEGETK